MAPSCPLNHHNAKGPLQERESHRYYSAWTSAQGSSLNVANHVDSIAIGDLNDQGYKPLAANDRALKAFAQLAALRLNVKRAMVSLIDTNNQYILAEATRGFDDSELWLGATVLSRPMAVCEHCFYNTAASRTGQDGQSFSCKGLIVNDCRLDPRFQDREYVVQEPGVRFYAGVPIVSPNGIMIGAYAVSDEAPRDGLSKDELRFMQEMSVTIMDHFEWARDRVDRFKGERIVRGMASFIESCTAPEDSSVSDTQDHAASDTSSAPTDLVVPTSRPPLTSRKSYARSRRSIDEPSRKPRSRSRSRGDGLAEMYRRAALALRDSTLADGAAIFGATPGILNPTSPSSLSEGGSNLLGDALNRSSPGSDGGAYDTSDSDTTPNARPCRVLALSLADDKARGDIEQGSPLTLATLERYFTLYPIGKAFSFTEQGSGISSDDESSSEREAPPESQPHASGEGDAHRATGRRKRKAQRVDHRELLKKIPGAKSVVFLPLYDTVEERLVAGCFLWTSVTGRMMSHYDDLSYLRAFGNSIMSEVMRINTQKNEAAKTTFIASMSHELRSPLHGILGATEFLRDTAHDSFQSALIGSISTCGKTLLETLNHVLDYSKINRLGKHAMRRNARQNKLVGLPSDSNLESLNMTAEIDLAVLVEEVVEAVTAGHAFKKLPASAVTAVTESSKTGKAMDYNLTDALTAGKELATAQTPATGSSPVSVLLDINPRRAWAVRTQPGALRRIIMNLIGNSLKYTSSGFVAVSLRSAEKPRGSKIETLIRVVDSGKGMSEDFQREKLFLPFSQEDTFQPGTGLGLSIVKQIVDSLGGTIEVKSQQDQGTEIDVQLNLIPGDKEASVPDDITEISKRTRGLRMVIDPSSKSDRRPPTNRFVRLEETLRAVCSSWFGLRVFGSETGNANAADICLYSEPPDLEELLALDQRLKEASPTRAAVPIIIVCGTAEEAIEVSRHQGQEMQARGSLVEVIPQPCGPRKLCKVLRMCLDHVDERKAQNGGAVPTDKPVVVSRPTSKEGSTAGNDSAQESGLADRAAQMSPKPAQLSRTVHAALSFPSPPPLNPETPPLLSRRTSVAQVGAKPAGAADHQDSKLRVLLVDDNKINLQLLVMFMKKHKLSYAEAENGQEAVDKFKEACLPGPHSTGASRPFDVCLMDISMPVMNGMEATKRIREFESENGLPRTMVIALTGLASAQAQKEAQLAGIDVFLPKPVKFAELKKLLDQKV